MFPDGSTSLADSLDNDKLPNANEQPAVMQQDNKATPSPAGGEVKLRDRRRRESAPVIGVPDPDQAHSAGSLSQQVRGARRISKGSQRAMLVSCLSEDSALEGLESVGEIHTPKGSRRNFIELMMSSSPQVGPFSRLELKLTRLTNRDPRHYQDQRVSKSRQDQAFIHQSTK